MLFCIANLTAREERVRVTTSSAARNRNTKMLVGRKLLLLRSLTVCSPCFPQCGKIESKSGWETQKIGPVTQTKDSPIDVSNFSTYIVILRMASDQLLSVTTTEIPSSSQIDRKGPFAEVSVLTFKSSRMHALILFIYLIPGAVSTAACHAGSRRLNM
jgi:hypothetical protein